MGGRGSSSGISTNGKIHHGYNHRENDTAKGFSFPDSKEEKMVERILKIWKEKGYAYWEKWKGSR